jgi:activator of HSP90 ATPase
VSAPDESATVTDRRYTTAWWPFPKTRHFKKVQQAGESLSDESVPGNGKLTTMKTKNIQHTVHIRATMRQVYDALMNQKQHTQFTGAPARIRAKVGAPFTCYNGYIIGITLELAPARRIVQAWRSRGWPRGHYSIVTFALSKRAAHRTQLRFTQVGVPAKDYAAKTQGWRTHYWQPLKRFLGK